MDATSRCGKSDTRTAEPYCRSTETRTDIGERDIGERLDSSSNGSVGDRDAMFAQTLVSSPNN